MNKFSIVTPSFNMMEYIPFCINSVSDQKFLNEHIIIDGLSSDGTVEFLNNVNGVKACIEKDNGMYDAINKGIKQAKGDFVGQLNCDEQYLPNVLAYIKEIFDRNPSVDIIHADKININNDYSFHTIKRSFKLNKNFIVISHLYAYTCSTFYRRRIFDEGNFFNPNYKSVGDVEFILRLLSKGYKSKHISCFTSTFMNTGKNLSLNTISRIERAELEKLYGNIWTTKLKNITNIYRILIKFIAGTYKSKNNLLYEIYCPEHSERKTFKIGKATFRNK